MLCTYIRNVAITDNVSSYLPTTLSCNAVAGPRNLGQPLGRPSTGRLAVNPPVASVTRPAHGDTIDNDTAANDTADNDTKDDARAIPTRV